MNNNNTMPDGAPASNDNLAGTSGKGGKQLDHNDLLTYILEIRKQDIDWHKTLLTLFGGTIFGAILVAAFTAKGGHAGSNKFTLLASIFGFLALIFFLGFLAAMRAVHGKRKELCHTWLSSDDFDQTKSVVAMLKAFSEARVALSKAKATGSSEKIRKLLQLKIMKIIWPKIRPLFTFRYIEHFWLPSLAAFFLYIAICLSSWPMPEKTKPADEVKVIFPTGNSPIQVNATLDIGGQMTSQNDISLTLTDPNSPIKFSGSLDLNSNQIQQLGTTKKP